MNLDLFNKPEYFFQPKKIVSRILHFKDNYEEQRTVKTAWGTPITINSTDDIGIAILQTGVYDLSVTESLWRLIGEGDFVIDVGANIGYTGNLCSFRVGVNGKVWLFEPNQLLFNQLEQNINDFTNANVELFKMGLSNKSKTAVFNIPKSFSNNKGIGRVVENVETSEINNLIQVELKRLDDLIAIDKEISVMKIDVEGHELQVLKGAQQLLSQNRINNIVYEDFDKYPSEISSFLENFGYTIFRLEKRIFRISLTNPTEKSKISKWEPTNYIATLNKEKLLLKFQAPFFMSLSNK